MKYLLDANVLIALSVEDHVHHDPAESWLMTQNPSARLAVCPITQGALIRLLIRSGVGSRNAQLSAAALVEDARFEFWPDAISYADISMTGVIGHRQVTDAYLAALARHHGARLTTFDAGLAELHPDVVELIGPTTT